MTSYLIQHGHHVAAADKLKYMEAFGSVQRAIFTLFQATTGGNDWAAFYKMVEVTGWLYACLFVFYIAFFIFAAMNIVTSIFMDKAMRLAQPDVETLLFEKQKEDFENAQRLKELCQEIDTNGDNSIDFHEFKLLMSNAKVRSYFELKGLGIKDASSFFRMLSEVSPTDKVEIDSFISGCMKMKGFALSVDLLSLGFETKLMKKHQENMFNDVSRKLDMMVKLMCAGSVTTRMRPQTNQRNSLLCKKVVWMLGCRNQLQTSSAPNADLSRLSCQPRNL